MAPAEPAKFSAGIAEQCAILAKIAESLGLKPAR
jgi:hypothetical protein